MTRHSSKRGGRWGIRFYVCAVLVAPAAGAVVETYVNSTNLPISCNNSQGSTIAVPDIGTITDVNVLDVTLQNPELADVTITLTDPSGTNVVIKGSGDGGLADAMTNIDFDDSAAASFPGFLTNSTCLSNQLYQPDGSLADYNGLQVNGNWTLTVAESDCTDATDCDCVSGTGGPACVRMLDNWALQITFDAPPPCDTVTVDNETIATMQTREACRSLVAGPALMISTDFGATLVAGEVVELGNGVTVNTSAQLTVGTCTHSLCGTGAPLMDGCTPCVTSICAVDSFCCTNSWDVKCVGEVGSVCGLACP